MDSQSMLINYKLHLYINMLWDKMLVEDNPSKNGDGDLIQKSWANHNNHWSNMFQSKEVKVQVLMPKYIHQYI